MPRAAWRTLDRPGQSEPILGQRNDLPGRIITKLPQQGLNEMVG